MRYLAICIWFFIGLVGMIATFDNSDVGKNPDDEISSYYQEVKKDSGELMNVQVVRCKLCGEVTSHIRYTLNGKLHHRVHNAHRCGQYANGKYKGSGLGAMKFHILQWLDKWQRRLRFNLNRGEPAHVR